VPQRVNLDAMIPREDFRVQGPDVTSQQFGDFPIRNLEEANPVRRLLRKPDFQRETNHWSPEQLATFLGSFLDNELIPSLILWKSSIYIFVIDGGHRLSALRAWMENDYGDGAISREFYKGEISNPQKKAADAARKSVERVVGRYSDLQALVASTTADAQQQRRASNLFTRALNLQWVQGNVDVAESSFFKINSQGTPLDDVEEMLLKNRKKGLAIGSRAIIRAGTGHKYWSDFSEERQREIEAIAAEFHDILFDPELASPIKTLDLPIGGSVSPVDAQALLVDFLAIASARRTTPRVLNNEQNDEDGTETLNILEWSKAVASRMTGNQPESLGLHPAVYFYNERGVHARHLFLGVVTLIAEKLRNNDDAFFKKFTSVRRDVEKNLITHKALITQLFANVNQRTRVVRVRDMLETLVRILVAGEIYTTDTLLASVGYSGQILDIQNLQRPERFSAQTKSAAFLRVALDQTPKCPLCGGLLFPLKAISYDHAVPVKDGGRGDIENAQLMHPYCNSIKEDLQ
jgi:hypothetical protein